MVFLGFLPSSNISIYFCEKSVNGSVGGELSEGGVTASVQTLTHNIDSYAHMAARVP